MGRDPVWYKRAVSLAPGLAELRGRVRVLLTDVDGTLTTKGRLEATTLAAIERLVAAGIHVVPVTGRPAGFGLTLMTLLPVTAVVSESGAVIFSREGAQLRKQYGVPLTEVAAWRARAMAAAREIMNVVPGALLSADTSAREIEVALDWNEAAQLTPAEADRIVTLAHAAGLAATRSSIHVNLGPPGITKYTGTSVALESLARNGINVSACVFVGDAENDASMFAGMARTVGVANIAAIWDRLSHKPAYLTHAAEGAGFRELAERLVML